MFGRRNQQYQTKRCTRLPALLLLTALGAPYTGADATPLNASQKREAATHRESHPQKSGVWQIRRQWTEKEEQGFADWIAHLFRPLDGQKNRGWRALHQVLRSPVRNSLYNRLGLSEDDPRAPIHVKAVADCGDTPYMLRAYFAWKRALPFRFRQCSRGNAKTGPKCRGYLDNTTAQFDDIAHPTARFNAFIGRAVAWQVHSGTLRTLPEDDGSDFYPIPLSADAIRPGTVFVDTGGHVLVVSQLDENGLFGIDGHPDKTVTRRAFSPKYFPFVASVDTGGFKAFRPIRFDGRRIVSTPNRALNERFSTQQYGFSSAKRFFSYMDALLRN